jgi:hypothetical protein
MHHICVMKSLYMCLFTFHITTLIESSRCTCLENILINIYVVNKHTYDRVYESVVRF